MPIGDGERQEKDQITRQVISYGASMGWAV